MEKGGITSHAVIIAKSLGIPCLINAEKVTKKINSGDPIILDANEGTIVLNPSDKILKEYAVKLEGTKVSVKADNDIGFETKDGYPFQLMANVEFEVKLPRVLENNAQGIGLLKNRESSFWQKAEKRN
ncbi:MAG: PEP-utilizing enzyme [Gracilimonas sp.]|nr:PEP-utilizing enzyme [Gracilimonas sp.]